MIHEDDLLADEARLEITRKLSGATIELLVPDQAATFPEIFATWAALPRQYLVKEDLYPEGFAKSTSLDLGKPISGDLPPDIQVKRSPDRGLDTTLVAGLFFQVILEAERLPVNSQERSNFVRREVKNFLVQRLAGQITLSQFFRLMHLIDTEITHYFDRLRGEWLSVIPAETDDEYFPEEPQLRPLPEPVLGDKLRQALAEVPLPQQANRKLSAEGLLRFLIDTRGNWFRLLDFEFHFSLNKKTAWTYLSMLLQHDILRHNEQKANRVRYALTPRFLVNIGSQGV